MKIKCRLQMLTQNFILPVFGTRNAYFIPCENSASIYSINSIQNIYENIYQKFILSVSFPINYNTIIVRFILMIAPKW